MSHILWCKYSFILEVCLESFSYKTVCPFIDQNIRKYFFDLNLLCIYVKSTLKKSIYIIFLLTTNFLFYVQIHGRGNSLIKVLSFL